jgi:Protein of unknown function (DUF2911)
MSRPRLAALVATLLAAGPAGLAAQGPPPVTLQAAPSTLASVEVHVNARLAGGRWYPQDAALAGPSRIAITYGQPHARGRQVEGGLIPVDTVWRFGANAATTLHTDVNLRLGGLDVPQGDYSLFILYTGSAWSLIVNRGTGQWGTDYDSSKDLGRVPLAAQRLAETEDALSVYLVPDAAHPSSGAAKPRGLLRIKWGHTQLSTSWQVEE